jgi:hypothetical protein
MADEITQLDIDSMSDADFEAHVQRQFLEQASIAGENHEVEVDDTITAETDDDEQTEQVDALTEEEEQGIDNTSEQSDVTDDDGNTDDSDINNIDNDDPGETEETNTNSEEVTTDDDGQTEETDNDSNGQASSDNQEKSGETEKPQTTEEVIPEVFKVKANGTEIDLSREEVIQLASKGANYTQKMQEMSPYRKMISAIKQQNITEDKLNLALDVLKGDKDAIMTVIKQSGIDTLELDTEKEIKYTPNSYGLSEQQLAIQEVEDSIKGDEAYGKTVTVINDLWDPTSKEVLRQNPSYVRGLHDDIKSGLFDRAAPIVTKLKALGLPGSKSDIDYYIEALGQLDKADKVEAEKQQKLDDFAKREADLAAREQALIEATKKRKLSQANSKATANKRRAAATPQKAAGKPSIIDYLDEASSDEEFAKAMEDKLRSIKK